MFEDDIMDFLTDDDPADGKPEAPEEGSSSWKVMIVDDDPSVHEATTFSLSRVRFLDRGITWISAYSAKEAKLLLEQDRDIAMLFLDVVMEDDHAGLAFAKWFREEHINPSTRIILRTGQPGQAPEEKVIVEYDLHDYKTKTEMSSDKLFTSTISALRAFNDMTRLESLRKGLENVVAATTTIFQHQTLAPYLQGAMEQTAAILGLQRPGILIASREEGQEAWQTVSISGTSTRGEPEILALLAETNGSRVADDESYVIERLKQDGRNEYALYLEPSAPLTDVQERMLALFCNSVSVGLSNIRLYGSLVHANRVTVMAMAHVTESRDQSTGEHVYRIAAGTDLLAKEMLARGLYPEELTEEIAETLGFASTLHDIGKVTIRDEVLLKPGKLTDEEFAEIKTHTTKGAEVLDAVLQAAGEKVDYLERGRKIALGHHERWDGRGYPHRVAGKDIPIEARITSLLDVFDALTHARCYKPAMPLEEACRIISEGRGTAFDPEITDVFLDIVDRIAAAMP